MKKLIYIFFLIAITPGLKAQFAAVYSNEVFTPLENDSALLVPSEDLRGTFQWQKSTDLIDWTDVVANLPGDTLSFVPELTEVYRLQITEGNCIPIYSDSVKVFSKTTTLPEYLEAGIPVDDLLDAGITISELFEAGVMVGSLEQSGVDSLDLANAGLIGVVADFDGNTYKWVRIGDGYWMAENLKTTHFADGTAIPLVESDTDWGKMEMTDTAYCYYDNSSDNGETYGALYTWAAAMKGAESNDNIPSGVQGVCPDGWHLPSDAEWKQLEISVGMSEDVLDNIGGRGSNEGSKLGGKADLWNEGDLKKDAAFGSSGFEVIPGGKRAFAVFIYLGELSFFWSATEDDDFEALHRNLNSGTTWVYRNFDFKVDGNSVRCLMD